MYPDRSLPDPRNICSSPDPGSAYAELVRLGPVFWHDGCVAWVVSDTTVAREALEHPALAVRPAGERLPAPMIGTQLGEVFGRLTRFSDGERHRHGKRALETALSQVDLDRVQAMAYQQTVARWPATHLDLAYAVPALALAELLGIDTTQCPLLLGWVGAVARAIGPVVTDADVVAGDEAVIGLMEVLEDVRHRDIQGSLLSTMLTANREAGLADRDAVANAIGLFFQVYDATAGLITGSLATHASVVGRGDGPSVAVVAQQEPPIQNTRRFATADLTLGGQTIEAGSPVLILLAGRNLEGAGNLPFGHGSHACPGRDIAIAMATGCVAALSEVNGLPAAPPIAWLPLPNARVANFEWGASTQ